MNINQKLKFFVINIQSSGNIVRIFLDVTIHASLLMGNLKEIIEKLQAEKNYFKNQVEKLQVEKKLLVVSNKNLLNEVNCFKEHFKRKCFQ